MTDAARSPRIALVSGWEIAREGEGAPAWRAVDAPLPVAALLAQSGEWSIEGPARGFDAETWLYRVKLDAPAAGGRLVFDGLATCCEVSFNGRPVLTTRNMFRRHVVDIPAAAWKAEGGSSTTWRRNMLRALSTAWPLKRISQHVARPSKPRRPPAARTAAGASRRRR